MKYIIIGDSWGMGEFVSKGLWIEPVPDTGIEHYLREAGHNVDNYAVGSACNASTVWLAVSTAPMTLCCEASIKVASFMAVLGVYSGLMSAAATMRR